MGFAIAMEVRLPPHDVTGAVRFALKPLKTLPGNVAASSPFLMFVCTVAMNVATAGTVT